MMVGRKTPKIFSAVLTISCRVLRSEMVQFPNQPVIQLLRMLSTVSLLKVVDGCLEMVCWAFFAMPLPVSNLDQEVQEPFAERGV